MSCGGDHALISDLIPHSLFETLYLCQQDESFERFYILQYHIQESMRL